MLFQMSGVFAEFERAMIVERVNAGLRRAKAEGTKLGRPRVSAEIEGKIREQLALGLGIHRVAKLVGCGSGTVQRVRASWSALKDFTFDYDRTDIRSSEQNQPSEIAAYARQNPAVVSGSTVPRIFYAAPTSIMRG
jgi:outer membrane protein OmpA-like peptidoglycan-associated protein